MGRFPGAWRVGIKNHYCYSYTSDKSALSVKFSALDWRIAFFGRKVCLIVLMTVRVLRSPLLCS